MTSCALENNGDDIEKEKEKLWKPLPTLIRKRSHFGTKYRKAPPPRKGKEKSMGIRRVAGST
jgi:hypothetical protein